MFQPHRLEVLVESELASAGFRLDGLVWTSNRVSLARRKRKNIRLRVSRRLLLLGERIASPIAQFATGGQGAKRSLTELFRALPPLPERKKRRRIIRSVGEHYDLRSHLEGPCSILAMDLSDVVITWGPRRRVRRSQRTYRLGSYDPSRDLVRIHRILDHPRVPAWYLEYVIFHELIHRDLGLRCGVHAARRHNKEFREIESRHPRVEAARRWERDELPLLSGSRRS